MRLRAEDIRETGERGVCVSQGATTGSARPADARRGRGHRGATRAPGQQQRAVRTQGQLWEGVGTVPVYSCPAVRGATGKWGERAP